MKNCIFCKIVKGEVKVKKIYENDSFFSMADANPVVKGHSLIISKKHFATLLDLPVSLGGELLDAIKKTSLRLIKENKASGFNVMNNNFKSAGQAVNHIHFHLIPRKKGDKLKHFYLEGIE